MDLYYWTSFSKRKNSTKQPTSGTPVDVVLKDPTSVLNPTIRLRGYNASDMVYAYIPSFQRYYFVESVTYEYPDTVIGLTVDPMASFKTDIGSYNGLLERTSDVNFYTPTVTDPLNSPTQECTHMVDKTFIGGTNELFTDGVGTFVLTVMGDPPANDAPASVNGIARSYALGSAQMSQIAVELLNPTKWQAIVNHFVNPMDAIISCIWMPIPITKFDTQQETISLANQAMLTSLFIKGRKITRTGTINTNGIYPTGSSDNYLLRPPYASYALYLPFVGVVPIDANVILSTGSLKYEVTVDAFTGDVIYVIQDAGGEKIATFSGTCGTTIPVGSSGENNPLGVAGGILTAIGGAIGMGVTLATGGGAALLQGAATFAAGAGAAMHSAEIHTQINGANSSALGAQAGIMMEAHSWIYVPINSITTGSDKNGLVCHKYGTPSNHPGFCQFINPSISIAGYDAERDQINDMMAEGFFYE